MIWPAGHSLQNGKYIIETVLGQGGFGITYKAKHMHLDGHMVIKTPNEYMRHDPDYDKYVDRFIKEGQWLKHLSQKQHPNIVRVRDSFEEDGTHCIAMDFVPGETLFQLVGRRGALPEADIVPIIRQIADALTMMHQAGLVHRDAHPGNIIVQEDTGKAILIDFGIAKELIPSTQSTVGIAGNRGFAPYEQMTGRSSREPSVDVYCLAATLYYAVTGKPPATAFDRKLHSTALASPKRLKPSISYALDQAIMTGMELEAKDRPQSMQTWLTMLDAPKPSSPSPQPLPSPPRQRRTKPILWKAFVALLGYAVSGMIFSWKAFVALLGYAVSGVLPFLFSAPFLVLLGYAVSGMILFLFSAPFLAWAWAWAWALAVAGTGAVIRARTVVRVGARLGVVAMTSAVVGAVAAAVVGAMDVATAAVAVAVIVVVWAMTSAVVGAVAVAAAVAGDNLLKSFTKLQTFMILAGISVGGLGLGWLIGAGLRPLGVEIPTGQ